MIIGDLQLMQDMLNEGVKKGAEGVVDSEHETTVILFAYKSLVDGRSYLKFHKE